MATISITVPDDKAQDVANAMAALYPIPSMPDPAWVPNPLDPSETAPPVPKYTKPQWVREKLRRFVAETLHAFKRKQATSQALDGVAYDDTVAQ